MYIPLTAGIAPPALSNFVSRGRSTTMFLRKSTRRAGPVAGANIDVRIIVPVGRIEVP